MKTLVIFILLALLLALMVSTNPTSQDYSEFFRNELVQPTEDEEDDILQALIFVFSGITENVISSTTNRKDYVILSTYETDIETYHIECIGMFGQFFGCSSTDD
jgi:transposase